MKKYSKSILTLVAVSTVFCFLPMLAHAQGPDPDVPIDGGLSILLAGGIGYGIKKIRDSRKEKLKDTGK